MALRLLLFLTFFIFSFNLFAGDRVTTPIVGIMNYYPQVIIGNDGKVSGAAADYMKLILDEANIDTPIIVYPISRLVNMLVEGELDITFLYKSNIMEPHVDFLGNLNCVAEYIVPRTGLSATDLEDMVGKTIGVTRGGYFFRKFGDDDRFTLVEVSDVRSLIKMAASGRVDAFAIASSAYDIVLNDPSVKGDLEIENIDDMFGTPIVLEKFEFHLVISKQSPSKNVGSVLSSTISSLKRSGKLSEVKKRYHISEMECD
jgi:ABC-type amino acid transport substrate-binding protein